MDNPEAYTLSPPARFHYFKFLKYFGFVAIVLYLWLTVITYQDDGWSRETIINGAITFIWAAITYSYFKAPFPHSQITLSQNGLSFKENKEHRSIAWNDLQNVTMTNNPIFLRGNGGIDKELDISHLEYKRLRSGTYICSVEVSGSKLM